ncbi:MAG: hypothetical protein DLM63_04320 [Solirubrobacterales bacterium]|nr:MAG: hypothetical protein DLM63_04320 [Solirubrobacterales bacterium]
MHRWMVAASPDLAVLVLAGGGIARFLRRRLGAALSLVFAHARPLFVPGRYMTAARCSGLGLPGALRRRFFALRFRTVALVLRVLTA